MQQFQLFFLQLECVTFIGKEVCKSVNIFLVICIVSY